MRLRTFLFPTFLGMALSAFGAAGDVTYTDNLISIKVRPGNDSAASAAIKRVNGTVTRTFSQIGWKVVKLPNGTNVANVLKSLKAQSSLSKVERVYMDHIDSQVNDPLKGQQWSLDRIQLPQAWDLSQGDRNVIVAIIDTGIDRGHPDLTGRILPGYDFVNNDADPDDDNGHGTHCAGIAAASTNNTIGVAGAGYNVTILPIKAANAGGGLAGDWIVSGILYAADHGANVISMSFGGYGNSSMENDALQYAYATKGALLVAAAGNDNTTQLHYPSAFPNVISVASSDPDDTRSGFSNYGADHTHVAAPGNGILSTYPRSLSSTGYELDTGTSMACPLVAGVAALLISYAGPGTLTNTEIRNYIQGNTDPIVGNYVQYGRVNAYKALLAIPSVVVTPDPTDLVPVEGSLSTTDAGTITTVDGISTTITSVKKTGVGLTGAASTSFGTGSLTMDRIVSGTLRFNMTGDRLGVVQVYLKNAAGKWVLFKTIPGNQTSTSLKLTLAQLTTYMPTGELNVMVRAYVPTRLASQSTGVTRIDQLQLALAARRAPAGSTP